MYPLTIGASSSEFKWEGVFLAVGALLLVIAAWCVIGYLIFFVANVLSGVKAWATKQQLERNALAGQAAPVHGFPVVTEAGVQPGAGESGQPVPVQDIGRGPGRYRILGVVAATGTDIQMYVSAETPANAKVKAELKGVIVTEVEKQ
jgi:hypothetical protein